MRPVAQVMRNERTQRPEVGSGTHFGASNFMDYTDYTYQILSGPYLLSSGLGSPQCLCCVLLRGAAAMKLGHDRKGYQHSEQLQVTSRSRHSPSAVCAATCPRWFCRGACHPVYSAKTRTTSKPCWQIVEKLRSTPKYPTLRSDAVRAAAFAAFG